MNWFKRLFTRGKVYDELTEEIRQHLDERVEALMSDGMRRDEAEHTARREFGNVTLIEERGREAWQWPTLDFLWADVRFGLRQIVRYRAFTIMAVTTLALGIGANTAIFTLLDSIVLQPLPYPQQDRLATISAIGLFPKGWIRALADHSQSFSSIAGFGPNAESNVSRTDAAERVFGATITVNALDTLGLHPAAGQFFSAENAVAGRDQVVVLGYGYWQQRFGGSLRAIGQTLRVDGVDRSIIGVMPPGIHFPYADTQFLIPVSFRGRDPIDPWNGPYNLQAFGRLKDGVQPAAAQAELRRLHSQLLLLFPWRMPDIWASDAVVTSLLDSVLGDTRPRLMLLSGAVGLILLIACANVANLMLARAASRQREMAIRGALGASGPRIIRQLLVESILLGMLAGIAGLIASALSLRGLTKLLPADTPRIADIGLHWEVFLFAAAASVLTGVIFGLMPAIKMASPHLQQTLRSGRHGIGGKGSQFRLSMLLVVGQIGLSVIVITAAGLMLHSLYALTKVDPGFRTERIVTAEVSLDANACREQGRCRAFFQALSDQLRGIAGVDNAALIDSLPMTGRDQNYAYDAEGHPRSAQQGALVATSMTVSSEYFKLVGLKLLRGRLLTDSDESGTSRVAVINQRMADLLWPNQDPIGKHILSVNEEKTPAVFEPDKAAMVVGVVSNTHHAGLGSAVDPELYFPMTPVMKQPAMTVLLSTRMAAPQAAAALRRAVAELDPRVPVTRVRSFDDVVAASAAAPRALAILLFGFGGLAVGVGSAGVYSLIAYIVSWRTQELGIRLALGAPRWQIMRAVVRQSLMLSVAGSMAGLAGALVCASLLRPLLMLLLAVIAAWVPAMRAASIDPMVALRSE
jgi:predicted permease